MDKNKIKSFAVWARRKMIESVTEKAERIGITKDKIEEVEVIQGGFKLGEETFYLSVKDRNALIHQIDEKGFEEVMEEVAYTWFNRFMGLRYMEVNEYLPSGIRILSSSVEGKVEPDVLSKVSDIIEELDLTGEEIYNLLDSGTTNDREKAYRIILVKQCNELGKIIPQMFEKISDYTELLLPDNLLEDGSVIRKMVEDIEEDDWKEEVEIIGWMYQYYISEKKDEVFAALKKNIKITKENIPAATQLFTPKWIVKYMVENSLGRLWLEGHPNIEVQSQWKYYLEEAEQEPEVEKELKKIREEHAKLTPEDIKVLDPCMGSGHILVYAFDVLYEIYKTAGYSEREIPKLILQNNLYGLDIDDRAAQLASFALIMKARHYNRRLFREIEREDLELNLCSIQESNEISEEAIDYFANGNEELKNDVKYLVDVFTDAKEYGSILEIQEVNFEALKQRLMEIEQEDNFLFGDYRKMLLDKVPMLIKQAEIMSRKYEVCVTNPPYMGNGGMDKKLTEYVKANYKDTKNDMSTVFMEKTLKLCNINGVMAMINIPVWMFLSSYQNLREGLIKRKTIINMIHLGRGVFGSDFGTTSFVIKNREHNGFKATYRRLYLKQGSVDNIKQKEKWFFQKLNNFNINQKEFLTIPGMPFAYWIGKDCLEIFNKNSISDYAIVKEGLKTADNERFVRKWYELNILKTNIIYQKNYKWVKHTKGGEYRRWYGNNYDLLNYENNGEELRKFKKASLTGKENYFKRCITWSRITISKSSFRFMDEGSIPNMAGLALYSDKDMYILAYLNSVIGSYIINILNPTINFPPGTISNMPMVISDKFESEIELLAKNNICISKNDWDSFETSWDFKAHPLLKSLDKGQQYKLTSIFNIWETECNDNFNKLKSNEEELNRIFIDIYGLQDELTPEVEDKDITIRKADKERDIKSLISYAVGCMLGRYSIDAEGLIYAGGEFSDKWDVDSEQYKVKSYIDIQENDLGTIREYKSDENANLIDEEHELKEASHREEVWVNATFVPDKDNIIPITEDEYFEDDIVSRFIEFIKTVYGEDNLEENLDFIADSIGRKTSESARQAIRRYFIKDFYKDHLKIYQKRPIYWMFDSGKNDGFKCLIYMHRYNDQTVAKVRTDYLHTLQRKYEAEINRQQLIVDSSESSTKDKTVAKKKIDRINKQIEECREYDEVVAYLANEKISIDLDDGVKVNYTKFQDVKIINAKGKEVKMNLLAKI